MAFDDQIPRYGSLIRMHLTQIQTKVNIIFEMLPKLLEYPVLVDLVRAVLDVDLKVVFCMLPDDLAEAVEQEGRLPPLLQVLQKLL